MTKNDNETYTIKSDNRIYGRNVTADKAKEILAEAQERFNKLNSKLRKSK